MRCWSTQKKTVVKSVWVSQNEPPFWDFDLNHDPAEVTFVHAESVFDASTAEGISPCNGTFNDSGGHVASSVTSTDLAVVFADYRFKVERGAPGSISISMGNTAVVDTVAKTIDSAGLTSSAYILDLIELANPRRLTLGTDDPKMPRSIVLSSFVYMSLAGVLPRDRELKDEV